MVFEVLDTVHDQIIVFKLTEVFDHLAFDQSFEFAVDHLLMHELSNFTNVK